MTVFFNMLLASVLSSCGQTINPYSNAIIAAAANIPIAQKARTKKFAMFTLMLKRTLLGFMLSFVRNKLLQLHPIKPPSANNKCYNIF